LRNLADSGNRIIHLGELIDILTEDTYNENHWKEIWKNNRFAYLTTSAINNSSIVYKLCKMGCQLKIPDYLPKLVYDKIYDSFYSKKTIQKIDEFDEFKILTEKIKITKEVPTNFRLILMESLKENRSLFEKFGQIGILDIMNYDGELFPYEIGISTIKKISSKISGYEHKEPEPKDLQYLYIVFNKEESSVQEVIEHDIELKINTNFTTVFGETIKNLNFEKFIRLKKLLSKPEITEINPKILKETVFPYLIQEIKMWGCNALKANNIYLLIKSQTIDSETVKKESEPGKSNEDPNKGIDEFLEESDEESDKDLNLNQIIISHKKHENPFSRLDIIVGILNSIDPLVAQEILNNISKFPQALPLVIKDLKEKESYKVCKILFMGKIFSKNFQDTLFNFHIE
jgi:hypothetical protein